MHGKSCSRMKKPMYSFQKVLSRQSNWTISEAFLSGEAKALVNVYGASEHTG